MGIRSDVAVALKKNVWDGLSEESRSTLTEWFHEPESTTKEGHVLLHNEHIKWYHDSHKDLRDFYSELLYNFDDEDYLIVKACHDYPETTNGDLGEWHDNPWNIYKSVSVSIQWDG